MRASGSEAWVFVGLGVLGLLIAVAVGLLLGFSLADILLIREFGFAIFMLVDYGLILFGIWLWFERILGLDRRRTDER